MDTKSGKTNWDELIDRIKKERDELALKMHLGQKDLAAEWEQLEAKWKEIKAVKGPALAEVASQTTKEVGAAVELAAEELKKGYEKIRKLL